MRQVYEFRVTFDNAEMLVTAYDRDGAQDSAIEQMEDAGEVHGNVVSIKRVQAV